MTYTLTLTNSEQARPPERRSSTRFPVSCRSCRRPPARAAVAPRGKPSSATLGRSPRAHGAGHDNGRRGFVGSWRHRAEHRIRVRERTERPTRATQRRGDHHPNGGGASGDRRRPRPVQNGQPQPRAIRRDAQIHDHDRQQRPRDSGYPNGDRCVLRAGPGHLGPQLHRACSTHRPITCTLQSIAPGGRATIDVVARAESLGDLRNTASVATPTPLATVARTLASATTKITPSTSRCSVVEGRALAGPRFRSRSARPCRLRSRRQRVGRRSRR